MKKNVLLAPVMAAFLFTACNNAGDNQGSTNEEEETLAVPENLDTVDEPILESENADVRPAENALEWAGTYEGTLPCADCPGIKVELQINSDETFALHQEFLEKDMKGTETGTFSWDEESGVVALKNETGVETLYQVSENQMIRLDPDGNRVQGELADQYILKKTAAE